MLYDTQPFLFMLDQELMNFVAFLTWAPRNVQAGVVSRNGETCLVKVIGCYLQVTVRLLEYTMTDLSNSSQLNIPPRTANK